MELRQAVRFVEALEGSDCLRLEVEQRMGQGDDTEQVLADVSTRLGWPLAGREIQALLASAVAVADADGDTEAQAVLSSALADGAHALANPDLQDALQRQRQSFETIMTIARMSSVPPPPPRPQTRTDGDMDS